MKIGDYKVLCLLGKGGMSEVYEVENVRLGSHHALKLFTYEKNESEVRERFLAEGRLLAQLIHPRIVKVTDIGIDEESGRPYFVMDLVLNVAGTAQPLSDVPAGGADETEIARWYDDLREGLAYIHGKGIVHRDLKLQNILIGPDGHVVLTDFGISKITNKNLSETVDPVQTVVRLREGKNIVMGSLGYMAPELEMGVAASPASDWYALGVIVFKLLTGVWCDARTDVVGDLETYDPVWRRILPKLLHANPQGRECLSFAEEKAKDREAAEFKMEEKLLREKSRGHFARHVARYVGGFAFVLALLLGFGWYKHASDCRLLKAKMQTVVSGGAFVDFDEFFRIPPEARADECTDDEGRVIMPSREDLANTRIDALVLTHEIFSSLSSGKMSFERAIEELERLQNGFAPDTENPFDKWPGGFMQVGTDETMYWMLERALERFREIAEK